MMASKPLNQHPRCPWRISSKTSCRQPSKASLAAQRRRQTQKYRHADEDMSLITCYLDTESKKRKGSQQAPLSNIPVNGFCTLNNVDRGMPVVACIRAFARLIESADSGMGIILHPEFHLALCKGLDILQVLCVACKEEADNLTASSPDIGNTLLFPRLGRLFTRPCWPVTWCHMTRFSSRESLRTSAER